MAEGKGGKSLKGQQALEYLTTYSWVIVIISLVLAVFLFLGVFSGGASSGNYCIPTPGYSCAQPLFNLTGNISILLTTDVQASGPSAIYITGVSCSANTTTAPATFYPISIHKVTPGTYTTIDFRCPTLQHPNPIGSTFTGALWISYQTATQSNLQQAVAIVKATASTSVPSVNYCLPGTVNTINVGSYPADLAFSPTGSYVYVNLDPANQVAFISTNSYLLTNVVNAGAYPVRLAVSPNGQYLYSGGGSNTIYMINTATAQVMNVLTVPGVTTAISLNAINVTTANNYIYVGFAQTTSLPYTYNVYVLDGLTNSIVSTIPLWSINTAGIFTTSLVVSPNGKYVYATEPYSNSIAIINTATNILSNTVAVGQFPLAIFFNSASSKAYTQNSNSISVINTATQAVTNTIVLPDFWLGQGASYDSTLSPDNNYLYSVYLTTSSLGGYSYSLSTINTITNIVTNTLTFTSNTGIYTPIVSPNGAYVYLQGSSNTMNEEVYVVNTTTDKIINTIGTGTGTYGALSPDGAYLYVSGSGSGGSGVITIINTTNNQFVLNVTVPQGPGVTNFAPNGEYAYILASTDVTLLKTC